MYKKILLLTLILLLTGCYDHKELNSIAILTATEINKIDNEFIINAQVVNPQSKDTVSEQSPFFIYTGKGKTLQEAYRQIKLQSSRFLYPNHLQILIINENLAKEDVSQVIDFYLRTPHIRTEFNILIGLSDNILNITTPIDDISATSIIQTMETNNKYLGTTNLITFTEFANMSINKRTEIILPSITITNYNNTSQTIENTENTNDFSMYKLGNLSVFKDNKLLGYLTQDESITYNVIKNKTKTTLLTYECEQDKYMTLEMTQLKSDISYKDNSINIKINLSGNVNETMCKLSLDNTANIDLLQRDLEEYLENELTKNINNIIKTYNSDIFGFLDLIYKTDYNTYLEIKDNWYEDIYQNLLINVDTNIKIIGKGNVLEGNNEEN